MARGARTTSRHVRDCRTTRVLSLQNGINPWMIGWPNGSLRLAECDAKAEIRADRTRRHVHLARASLVGNASTRAAYPMTSTTRTSCCAASMHANSDMTSFELAKYHANMLSSQLHHGLAIHVGQNKPLGNMRRCDDEIAAMSSAM